MKRGDGEDKAMHCVPVKKQKEKMVLMGDAALLSCVAQQVRLCNCCRALITCKHKGPAVVRSEWSCRHKET